MSLDFFNSPNPSSHTMTMGSTQPLTEMSTRIFTGVMVGQYVGLTTSLPSLSRLSRISGSIDILQPNRPPQPVTGIALPCHFIPPAIIARQWLVKNIPVKANTTLEEMLNALFSLWSVSYKSRVCVSVYPLSLLGNGLVNTFL
jgi:hypothetical protein